MIRMLMAMVVALACAGAARAQMPDALKGTWVIDAEASTAYMKTSPKWTDKDAEHLPMIFKHLAGVVYIFADNTIAVATGKERQTYAATLKSRDGNTYVFDTKAGDQPITLTATLTAAGKLNVRSSATNDMDYYLWQRGQPAAANADEPKAAAPDPNPQRVMDATRNAADRATAPAAK
jgi:hypothetical protein